MEAGLMRHKVTVKKRREEKNEFGGYGEKWDDVITIRASIAPVSGREFISGMQAHSEVTHRVVIRYNKAVRPQMRLLFGERIFDILHIIDQWEMHHEMTIMCKELVT